MKYPRLLRHARALSLLATASLVATLLPAATGATTASAANAAFTSTAANQGSGDCMDDPGSSSTAGTQLIQWSCNGGTNQNWTFTPVSSSNAYTVTNGASGLCMDVSGRSTADNAKVIQYTCNGQTNQQFNLVTASGSNTFELQAVHSGKCIVPSGDSTANDTLLVQLPCSSASTRVWQLAGYGGGSSGGGGGNGTPCHASTCVQYNGGSNGVITESPKVYLVFYGSQWGGSGGSTQTQNEGFFKGLGTGGERWSRVLTQYCEGVAQGTQTCPANVAHIPYPASSVYGGTWFDSSQPAPAQPGDDLITEARSAAGHFGVSDLARSIFVIFSPAGTSAGGGYSWHTTTSDGYNVINAAYGEQNTIVTSHEYAETMTDVNGGWTTADKTSEVADLCGPDGNLTLTTGSFPVTSIWSNQDSGCVIAD